MTDLAAGKYEETNKIPILSGPDHFIGSLTFMKLFPRMVSLIAVESSLILGASGVSVFSYALHLRSSDYLLSLVEFV